MKTLLKLATQKTRLPILNNVLVDQDNRAIATDLDVIIQYSPTHLKDGLYTGDSIKDDMPITSDRDIADFPCVMPDRGEILGERYIKLDDLQFVAQAMSNEATRYYLCGIAFKGKDMDGLTDEERVLAWGASWDPSFDGVAIVDKDFTFRSVNPQFCQIVGVSPAELIGKRFQDITPPRDRDWETI